MSAQPELREEDRPHQLTRQARLAMKAVKRRIQDKKKGSWSIDELEKVAARTWYLVTGRAPPPGNAKVIVEVVLHILTKGKDAE